MGEERLKERGGNHSETRRQTYKKRSGGVNEVEGVRRDNQDIMSFSENEMQKKKAKRRADNKEG